MIDGQENGLVSDNFRTLMPLNWPLKIIGLGCNLKSAKPQRPYGMIGKTILRVSVLALIDCYTLYYKIKYLHGALLLSPSIKYTDILQMFYDFSQYIVDLYYVRKYGNAISFEYFKQYETIDQILGIVNYSIIRKNLLRLMLFFGILWASITVLDFGAWVLSYGWLESAVYSVAYVFLLIKILTTLDLTSQVMHIEIRLRELGDLMQTQSNEVESPSLFNIDVTKKEWLDYNKCDAPSKAPSSAIRRVACHQYHGVKWLSRCYFLLTEQVEFVNKMYGIRILLNTLSLLIDMVRFTNIAARILIGTQQTKYSTGYFPVVSSVMRMMTCASVLVSLVWHCEQVYRERNRILDIIDHLLVCKNPNEDLKTAVTDFRNLIQARPVDLNMANFFRLDNTLLVSITSVVVTYTIILLQSIN